MTDTVKDTFHQHGDTIDRVRTYPERDRVLQENIAMQSTDCVAPTDGLRAFARFPEHEIERLAEKYPKYSDLVNPDAKLASAAINKLVNSPEGREYRVGGTSRKSFRFRNNPLARD
jgi:hypothetical protein